MFHYTVHFWPEDEMLTEPRIESGIIVSSSYSKAVQHIVDYYGSEFIVSIDDLYELDSILVEDDIKEMFPEV